MSQKIMKLLTGGVFADCAKDRELSLIRATGWLFHNHKSADQSLCHQAAGRQTRWYFLFCICQNWKRGLLECKIFQFQYKLVNYFSGSSGGRLALVHGEPLAFYVLVHCLLKTGLPIPLWRGIKGQVVLSPAFICQRSHSQLVLSNHLFRTGENI